MIAQSLSDAAAQESPSARRPPDCPVEDWLSFLGHRWNALALWHLQSGPLRYGELLERLPGITPKVLSERLAGLVARGLIVRSAVSTFPRGVIYELTSNGCTLVPLLGDLEEWARSAAPVGGPSIQAKRIAPVIA